MAKIIVSFLWGVLEANLIWLIFIFFKSEFIADLIYLLGLSTFILVGVCVHWLATNWSE
jgi:hypothetical protein